MAGYITRGQEKSVVLSASQVDTLVNAGSGDAALLYLLLQRLDGPVTPEALAQRLGWSLLRCNAAETALQAMGFLPRSPQPPAPSDEHRCYSAEELADLLENDAGFRMLVPQTEEKLGKKLKTADLQILAGLYDRMKPVSFSPVLLVSWGGVTVCMLISGILVDSNVLADTLLWLVAFPVFFLVWGNRSFSDLIKPIINGIYLSFALFFLISIRSYPLNGTYYYSFFMNLNGLAMYMTAVSVAAITDIFSQEKFSARMLLADVILGASAAVAYYSASRASQVVLLISGCVGAVVFLIAKKETMGKKVLCYLLPAVLSLAILVPNTAVVINGANKAVVKFEKTWIKEKQKTPENPANPGNNQQIAEALSPVLPASIDMVVVVIVHTADLVGDNVVVVVVNWASLIFRVQVFVNHLADYGVAGKFKLCANQAILPSIF